MGLYRKSYIPCIACSPSSDYIAYGGSDGIIHIVSIKKKKKKINSIRAHKKRIQSLAFSSDGNYLYSGSEEFVRVWQMKDYTADDYSSNLFETTSFEDDIKADFSFCGKVFEINRDSKTYFSMETGDQILDLTLSPNGIVYQHEKNFLLLLRLIILISLMINIILKILQSIIKKMTLYIMNL